MAKILPLLLISSGFQMSAAEVVASGTGFAITNDGHVLTNAHVVAGCGKITARIGGMELSAQTVSIDSRNDLALLKISGTFSVVLPLRDGTRVRLGEPVVAFGYPLQGITSSSLNMTTGNVSALAGLGDDARLLQFTAPIQPGNSGGPLVDESGNVIGVVTSKLSPLWAAKNLGDVPQNVNFALKASVIRDFLESRSVEYQARSLTGTIPVTELPGRVSGAILPLQCVATSENTEAKSNTVPVVGPTDIQKRPGVLVAGYGPAESFQYTFLEIQNALATYGVLVANNPSSPHPVTDDSLSIQNLLKKVQAQGSDSLLYLRLEHGWSNIHRVHVQCFDAKGTLLWEEKASSATTWATTEQGAARAVVEQLKKKLKPHVGKAGLPLR